MRFANPPGLASFMAKNAGYDKIGGRAVKDATDQELQGMNTVGQAQANALSTLARDEAEAYARDAEVFGIAKEADANLAHSFISGLGQVGRAAVSYTHLTLPTKRIV